MTASVSPIFCDLPRVEAQTFVNADGTGLKTCFTPGADGARVDGIIVCSNDTAAVNLAFYLSYGGTDYYIGNILVPIGSGYTTIVKVDALATLRPNAINALILPNGTLLKANAVVAVTAAKTVTVTVLGGDY